MSIKIKSWYCKDEGALIIDQEYACTQKLTEVCALGYSKGKLREAWFVAESMLPVMARALSIQFGFEYQGTI